MKRRKKDVKRIKDMKWYNARLYCSNLRKKSAIEKLIDDIYAELDLTNPGSNTKKKKMALNIILSNAYEESLTGKFVAIPFYRGYYTTLSKSNPDYNTYQFIVGGTKALIKYDYLDYKPASYNYLIPENNSVSGIKATKKLIEAIAKYTEPLNVVQNYFETDEVHTYTFSSDELAIYDYDCIVELKDASKAKKLIDYRPNEISIRSKKFLREYNLFISAFDIKIPLSKVDPSKYPLLRYYPDNTSSTRTQSEYTINTTIPLIGFCAVNFILNKKLKCKIKRVFNNGVFTEGGRLYGAEYQFLSEAERSWILINGNHVVEIDYKSFHPRILYHKMSIDIKGDLYEMVHPSKVLRPAIKKMLNIMINTKSDYRAVKAFEKALFKDEDGGIILTAMVNHRIDEWDLIALIKKAHKPIEKYFGSNIGVKMQYEDSELAIIILTYFMKKKINCLTIHDSFIVEEKYKDELYNLMMNEYKKMFGFEAELEINKREDL